MINEISFKALLFLLVFYSCNSSISQSNSPTIDKSSKESISTIETVLFNHYDKRTKQFIPNRETILKYDSQGGTIESSHFRTNSYGPKKTLVSKYLAKYSDNLLTEYISERGNAFYQTKYKFDEKGNVTNSNYLKKKDEKFILENHSIYEYENNLLVLLKSCSGEDTECNNPSNLYYEFDSLGRKISFAMGEGENKDSVKYYYFDKSMIPYKVETVPFLYNIFSEDGKIMRIEKSYFSQYSQKIEVEKNTIIDYDGQGRVILIREKTEHVTEDSKYIYDKSGNLSELIHSSKSSSSLDQTKYVFGEYKEYPNFVTPAWFTETGFFWFKPKIELNRFINQVSHEEVDALVEISNRSFPTSYIEYWSKGKDGKENNWVPYQEVIYQVNEK